MLDSSLYFATVRNMQFNRDALAEIRLREGMSLSRLAVETGISLSYLSEIQSGAKTNVSLDLIRKIADALNVQRITALVVVEPEPAGSAA